MLKQFLSSNQIGAKYVHKGDHKVRLNRLEEFTEADKQWVLALMRHRVELIADFASKARSSKVKDAEKFRQMLTEGRFYFGQEAVENGLIDEISTPEEYFARHFKGETFKI